ncbi:MAG: UDP-2,3-diacylglucosamine diphosphatase LpxI [Deltaproteobacteria bacterium]|jgi:DUF1009 family protein|nr:UDP-2,3-diacylglucosamine diphosphatase LpxI [Deltaproteobacteria bacterium]
MEKTGIIAGSGQFPRLVAQEIRARGGQAYICGFKGHTAPDLADYATAFTMLSLGQLGKLISFFKNNEVRQLCMAGAIHKPKALSLRPDLRAARLFMRIRNAPGDDAILRSFAEELAREGIEVVQAAELVPSLRGPAGVLTARPPDAEDWQAIRRGWAVAEVVGSLDIGQCLVMLKQTAVAVEAMEGTDATLRRGGELAGPGCLALKMCKPGQDLRLDLPAIGLTTLEILAEYRYSCLAYEAEKTLFFDRDNCIALANKYKIALVGLVPEDLAEKL